MWGLDRGCVESGKGRPVGRCSGGRGEADLLKSRAQGGLSPLSFHHH